MSGTPQHTVWVSRDFGVTRVVVIGVNPEKQDNVIVQENVDGEWVQRAAYNSLSNDYAYTSAGDCAERLAKQIKRLAALTTGKPTG